MTNGGNVLEYKCGNKSLLSFIIVVDNKLYKVGFRVAEYAMFLR